MVCAPQPNAPLRCACRPAIECYSAVVRQNPYAVRAAHRLVELGLSSAEVMRLVPTHAAPSTPTPTPSTPSTPTTATTTTSTTTTEADSAAAKGKGEANDNEETFLWLDKLTATYELNARHEFSRRLLHSRTGHPG